MRRLKKIIYEQVEVQSLSRIEENLLSKKTHNGSLKESLKVSGFDAVMLGFTDSFLVPFFIALQTPVIVLGLVRSLPNLIASIALLFADYIERIFVSKKRIAILTTILQTTMLLPLVVFPHIFEITPFLRSVLFFFVVLNSVFAMLYLPFWTGLVGDMVNNNHRGKFYAKRNRINSVANMGSYLFAGIIMSFLAPEHILFGFSLLFSFAILAEYASVYFITRIEEVPFRKKIKKNINLVKFIKSMPKTEFGYFVLSTAIFRYMVFISTPFYAYYLLHELQYSYLEFTIVTIATSIASFISLNYWGRLSDKVGNQRVVVLGATIMSLATIFWIFSSSVQYLFIVNLFLGFGLAAYNLTTSNYVLDASLREERTSYSSFFNLFMGLSVVLGGLTGGIIIDKIPITLFGYVTPPVLLLSGIGRLAVTIFLLSKTKETRLVEVKCANNNFILINPSTVFAWESTNKPNLKEEMKKKIHNLQSGEKRKLKIMHKAKWLDR